MWRWEWLSDSGVISNVSRHGGWCATSLQNNKRDLLFDTAHSHSTAACVVLFRRPVPAAYNRDCHPIYTKVYVGGSGVTGEGAFRLWQMVLKPFLSFPRERKRKTNREREKESECLEGKPGSIRNIERCYTTCELPGSHNKLF